MNGRKYRGSVAVVYRKSKNWKDTGSTIKTATDVLVVTCLLHAAAYRDCDLTTSNSVIWLHCALSLATQCIVIGPVCDLCVCVFVCLCLWVCLWLCYHDNSKLRGFLGKGSDHLQLIKFWPSCAPGKGVCGSQRAVFASPSAFFIFNVSLPTGTDGEIAFEPSWKKMHKPVQQWLPTVHFTFDLSSRETLWYIRAWKMTLEHRVSPETQRRWMTSVT